MGVRIASIGGDSEVAVSGMKRSRGEDFLERHDLALKIYLYEASCPDDQADCPSGKHNHGPRYELLLKRNNLALYKDVDGQTQKAKRHGIAGNYWVKGPGRDLNAYPTIDEVLKYCAKAAAEPNSADIFWAKFHRDHGVYLPPSKAERLADFARRLRQFFTAEEYDELRKL